jgi:soluble lytic murein transglycosylase
MNIPAHFFSFCITSSVVGLLMFASPNEAMATTKHAAVSRPPTISQEQHDQRLHHAKELLGKHYRHSSVRVGEDITKINFEIYRLTHERLPAKYKNDYQKVAQAIIDESYKYEFDPVFLVSIIQSESSFGPEMKGKFGEIGLMQIMPATGKWISERYGLKWKSAKRTLRDPVANIRVGAAYLDYLRERFDSHARLYIAAYNMGPKNVMSAQEKNIWPKDYATVVMKSYVEFYQAYREKKLKATNHVERGQADLILPKKSGTRETSKG